jgi:hypothetical protein
MEGCAVAQPRSGRAQSAHSLYQVRCESKKQRFATYLRWPHHAFEDRIWHPGWPRPLHLSLLANESRAWVSARSSRLVIHQGKHQPKRRWSDGLTLRIARRRIWLLCISQIEHRWIGSKEGCFLVLDHCLRSHTNDTPPGQQTLTGRQCNIGQRRKTTTGKA